MAFTPAEDPSYDRTGMASFYGEDFHGRRTSNGEIFDMWALSAAHPTLPMPSYAYVTNLGNGRTLLVRINDRGPYARGRVIDLSRAAARLLGFEMHGTLLCARALCRARAAQWRAITTSSASWPASIGTGWRHGMAVRPPLNR